MKSIKTAIITICFLLIINPLQAQPIPADSIAIKPSPNGYYEMFQDRLTWRVLGSKKYTSMQAIPKADGISKTLYKPTAPNNTGIGGTYRFLTINIVYGFKPLNPLRFDIGKSKFLDAQSHFLGRKANTEFYGQMYRGFYSNDLAYAPSDFFRKDIKTFVFSVTHERVLNWRKYSLRAVLNQSERQLKSAGSPLLGWGFHVVRYKGDSAINFNTESGYEGIDKFVSWITGPTLGYAYTQVIARRAYIMAGATGQLGLHYTTEKEAGEKAGHFAITPNALLRAGAGYVGNRWGATLQWHGLIYHGSSSDIHYRYGSGRVLATVNYSIQLRKKNGIFRTIDKVSSWFGSEE